MWYQHPKKIGCFLFVNWVFNLFKNKALRVTFVIEILTGTATPETTRKRVGKNFCYETNFKILTNKTQEAMKFIKKLDKQSKATLKDLMKNSSSFKVRKRAHAILLSNKQFKIDELANIFDADRDTISEWLKRWEDKGAAGLKDAPRSGRPRKYKRMDHPAAY